MKYCPKCNKKYTDIFFVCSRCRTNLEIYEPPKPQPVAPSGTTVVSNDTDNNNNEHQEEKKNTGFNAIAGMAALKKQLQDDVINPLKEPEKYKKYGLGTINGFLMYGPPGCGKTFVAEKLAEETGRYFVKMTPGDVGGIYVHETAMNIRKKFDEAKSHAPAILFIDEAESIVPDRGSLGDTGGSIDYNENITELLQQMNNSKDSQLLIIIASNEPQKIDNAVKRTGRMDRKIYVGPPDKETRIALFNQQLSDKYHEDNINVEKLAEMSDYYTAEDIRMLLRNAAIKAMNEDSPISEKHIIDAFETSSPSISEELVEEYRLKGEL